MRCYLTKFCRWQVITVFLLFMLIAAWRHMDLPKHAFARGMAALDAADLRTAKASLDCLEHYSNWRDQANLLRGAYRLRLGDPEGGLREIAKVNFNGPLRPQALLFSGECLYQQKALSESLRMFGQALSEDAESATACRWIAAIYYDLGAGSLAIPHLRKLASLRPTDFSPYRLLGLIAFDGANNHLASEYFREALKRNPPSHVRTEIIYELVQALISQLAYTQALESLDDVKLDSKLLSGPTEVFRARCYLGMGEIERAKNSLKLASALCRNDAPYWGVHAELAMFEQNWIEAIDSANRALQLDPANVQMQYILVQANGRCGNVAESRRVMNELTKTRERRERLSTLIQEADAKPRDIAVREELAEVYRHLGFAELSAMWQTAAESCRRANGL